MGQSPGGKSWRLAPTVMLAPEHVEREDDNKEEEGVDWEEEPPPQQQSSDGEENSVGTSLASGSTPQTRTNFVRTAESSGWY